MSKNLKILIAFIVFGVIVSILLNRHQRKMSDRIREEEQLKTIENNTTENYNETTEEIMTQQINPPKYVEYEEFLISELNKDDFIIDDFNEKERQIYQGAAVWIRKSDNKLFFRGLEYDEINYVYTEPLDYIWASSSKYEEEMYLDYKKWVDKIGVDAVYEFLFNSEKVIYELCKKNCDFDKYMVTDNFKSKYSEKDGILGKVDYDDIEYTKEYRDGGAYDLEYTNIIITKGKVKTEYKIDYISTLDSSHAIDDIDIFSIRDLTNEQGEEIKLRMDENNWLNCIERLAFSDDDDVGKSDRFVSEHPNFNGIIPNVISILPATKDRYHITIIKSESNYDTNEIVANYRFDSMYISKKIKIIYTMDDNRYINSFDIEEIESVIDEYVRSDSNISRMLIVKILYEDDIDKLPLSVSFRDKNRFKISNLANEHNIIDILTPNNNNKLALTIIDESLNKFFYGLTFKIVDNLIDDVEITPLDIKEFPAGDAAFDLF